MLLNHTEEEIPDRKTSEAAKWLSDNNVQFNTPTFWLVAGLLNAYAAKCVRVERERCAGIARKHIESSTAQAIAREIKAAQAGGDTQTTEVPPIMVGKGCDREDVHPAWRAWRSGQPKSVLLRRGETENELTRAYDAIVKSKAEPSGGTQLMRHYRSGEIHEEEAACKESGCKPVADPSPSVEADQVRKVLIGGNHLASMLINSGCDPGQFQSFNEVQENFGIGIADVWICWKAIMEFRCDLDQVANCIRAERSERGAEPTAEVINRLVEWDKKYPRDRYQIVEYGTMRQCEKELDEICELAKLSLAALRGGKG